MQFQVPQFIETEDTIIGSITIRQFVVLSITGLAIFLIYFVVQTWLWLIFAVVCGGGTTALVLVKINGQPLAKIAWSAVLFYWNAQKYTWQPNDRPIEKTSGALSEIDTGGFSIEKILYSAALKSAWGALQTGEKNKKEGVNKKISEPLYEIIRKKSGETAKVRRVDFT
jgi:hypothetical protein